MIKSSFLVEKFTAGLTSVNPHSDDTDPRNYIKGFFNITDAVLKANCKNGLDEENWWNNVIRANHALQLSNTKSADLQRNVFKGALPCASDDVVTEKEKFYEM